MTSLFDTVAIALLLLPLGVGGQQPAASNAKDDVIGFVASVTGEWFVEDGSATPRRLNAGDELPPNSRLTLRAFKPDSDSKNGVDVRSIKLDMYDGSKRVFECSIPSTCDGPIPLAIRSTPYRDLYRSAIQLLHKVKLEPMIIGQAQPVLPGGVVELKEGRVELKAFAKTLAFEGTHKSSSAFLWCPSEEDASGLPVVHFAQDDDCRRVGSVNWSQERGAIRLSDAAARPGLYTLRLASTDDVSTTDAASFVLAVDSVKYRQLAQTYSVAMRSEVFSTLPPAARAHARILMLQALSDSVKR